MLNPGSMMAALFFLFTLAVVSILEGMRRMAIGLIISGIVLSLMMLWHHADQILQINW